MSRADRVSGGDYRDLGWRETIVLGTALRLGLVGAVKRPRSAAAVAGSLGLDRRAVGAVFEALAATGVLERARDAAYTRTYRLREEHRGPLLDPDHPDYAGALVENVADEISAWTRLPETLRSGEPVRDRTASPGATGSGITETFIRRMRREALPGAETTARTLLPRLPPEARILDVGGGPGAIAETLASKGARVTVFDLKEVTEMVRERLARAGVSVASGDMNDSLPDGPFDAVYLGHASHLYGPGENRSLFRRIYGALAPGGLLAVRDFVLGESAGAEMFAVEMLLSTPRGGAYAAEEYEEWLGEAGFEGFEVVPVPGRSTHLVLGRRPGTDG